MLLVFAALLASPAPSKWTVDFADAHCQATRTYGSGERALMMSIRPPLDPAATTRLTFEREIRELSGELEKSATIQFDDGGTPYRTFMQPALGPKGFRYILDLPQDQARRLRGSKVI